jgi:hypothetical protein
MLFTSGLKGLVVSFEIYKHQTLRCSVCISWKLPYFNVDNKTDIYLLLSKVKPLKYYAKYLTLIKSPGNHIQTVHDYTHRGRRGKYCVLAAGIQTRAKKIMQMFQIPSF